MFSTPPVQTALVRYIARGNREASVVVGRYIEQNSHRIRAAQPFLRPLSTQGSHHDLLSIFAGLNDKYFGGTIDALVTWGRVGPNRTAESQPRTTIKLGSYSAVERLIRIHPVLDKPWVPRYFVSYVYQDAHHVIPPVTAGQRHAPPPHFFAREQLFATTIAPSREQSHIAALAPV
jgi:hypothetical protein